MEKQLRDYLAFITEALEQLEQPGELSGTSSGKLRWLWRYHLARTAAFQHERLIHLLVTFFFGFLLLACIVCTLLWPLWQFIAIDSILIIILLFYIKHYFFLENHVQKLYLHTQRLYKICSNSAPKD